MQDKDARHCICKVFASWRAHYRPQGARHDFVPQDVMRHALQTVNGFPKAVRELSPSDPFGILPNMNFTR